MPITAQEYYRKAEEMREQAARAVPALKAMYLEIAEEWIKLAKQAERTAAR